MIWPGRPAPATTLTVVLGESLTRGGLISATPTPAIDLPIGARRSAPDAQSAWVYGLER
jgi:hypothetical protein